MCCYTVFCNYLHNCLYQSFFFSCVCRFKALSLSTAFILIISFKCSCKIDVLGKTCFYLEICFSLLFLENHFVGYRTVNRCLLSALLVCCPYCLLSFKFLMSSYLILQRFVNVMSCSSFAAFKTFSCSFNILTVMCLVSYDILVCVA